MCFTCRRLLNNIGKYGSTVRTNIELVAATKAFLASPNEEDNAEVYEERAAAKKKLQEAMLVEVELSNHLDALRNTMALKLFRRARVVACTASSAVHVARRLSMAVAENTVPPL